MARLGLHKLHRLVLQSRRSPRLAALMSIHAALDKVHSPVKELIVTVTENGTSHIGDTEKDKKEVQEWLEKAGQSDIASPASIQNLDSLLVPRTYLVSNKMTAADVALYGALHPFISRLEPPEYYAHPSLTRHFDHIQSLPSVRQAADTLSTFNLVTFDLVNTPKAERKPELPKKEKKSSPDAEKSVAPQSKAASVASDAKAPKEQGQKKDKKDKKKDNAEDAGKQKEDGKAAPVADDAEPVPSMIDLRVGHIVDVIKHPDADGLYVEQIDLGEETGPRTVVSGLVNYIPIEQMRDKYLVAVCNLKPANMRGVKSFAMVLCATSKEGKEGGIELIQPPANAKPGDRVYFEGENYENAVPLSQLNPKKKIFETIQPGFITLESKEAAWINPVTKSVHKIRTKDGVCVAPTFVGASLS